MMCMRGIGSRRLPSCRGSPGNSNNRCQVFIRAAQNDNIRSPNPSQNDSKTKLEGVAEAVEVTALGIAAGSLIGIVHSQRTTRAKYATKQQGTQARTAVDSYKNTSFETKQQLAHIDTSLMLSAPIFLAVAAQSLATRLARKRAKATPAAHAMARLGAAELSLLQQSESLAALARQVDKLQIRTRLVSRDVKDQVKQAQAAVEAQGQTLLSSTAKLSQLEDDIKTVESLVDDVQGLAAKQFNLLMKVIEQQQKIETNRQTGSQKKAPKAKTGAMSSAVPVETPPRGMTSRRISGEKTDGSGIEGSKDRDEWGRIISIPGTNLSDKNENKAQGIVKGMEQSEQQQTPAVQLKINEDGSVQYSF